MRRSTRLVGRDGPIISNTSSYPDGPPASDFERFVARLNLESFPSDTYARIDDILVYSLFTAKKNLQYSRRLVLQPALDDAGSSNGISTAPVLLQSSPQFTNDHASTLYRIQRDTITEEKRTSQEAISGAVTQILSSMPDVFKATDRPTLLHLLSRYSILYSDQSPVRIEKVSFDGGISISGGLKANCVIPPSTAILSTCGSMSKNVLAVEEQSVSAIEGPEPHYPGKRLVLGPFRFGNHDCDPNCQFSWIPKTRACVMWTLREIQPGQPITLKYRKDNSYFTEATPCACQTCSGSAVQLSPRPKTSQSGEPYHGKRTRRSGARERAKKRGRIAKSGGEEDSS